ncbi:MAG: hypothetical protein ACE5HX_14515, partial [bacterium]
THIKGYEHFDVFRDTVFGGLHGKADIIPQTPTVGKNYTTKFTYTVPEKYLNLKNTLEYKILSQGLKI